MRKTRAKTSYRCTSLLLALLMAHKTQGIRMRLSLTTRYRVGLKMESGDICLRCTAMNCVPLRLSC